MYNDAHFWLFINVKNKVGLCCRLSRREKNKSWKVNERKLYFQISFSWRLYCKTQINNHQKHQQDIYCGEKRSEFPFSFFHSLTQTSAVNTKNNNSGLFFPHLWTRFKICILDNLHSSSGLETETGKEKYKRDFYFPV